MDKRLFHRFFTVLAVAMLLSGCGNTPEPSAIPPATSPEPTRSSMITPRVTVSPDQEEEPILNRVTPEVFFELSSPKLSGRVMGSSGNIKARAILENLFATLGLIPLNQDYSHSIFVNLSLPVASSIVYKSEEDADRALQASQEYYIAPGKAYNGEYRILYQEPAKENEKVLYLVDENNETGVMGATQAIGYIYPKTPLFRSVMRGATSDLYLFINASLFEELKSHDGKVSLTLDIQAASDIQTLEGSNLVGLIPGENSPRACLALTAHYDGALGGAAALDNSAGLYGLLRLADKLSQYTQKKPLPFDIVVGALDGEEVGLIGSGFLAEHLNDSYDQILQINLDCIGVKGSDSYMAISEMPQSQALTEGLTSLLDVNGFKHVPHEGNFPSDHLPFEWIGIPAVTIGERDVDGIIHNEKDTAANVDLDEIERLADELFNFITENPEQFFESYSP